MTMTRRSRRSGASDLRRIGRAGSMRCALFTAPAQNMVYGDRDGNIGFIVPGHIPIRKTGDGRMPVEGASGEHDWTGFHSVRATAADVQSAGRTYRHGEQQDRAGRLSVPDHARLGCAVPDRTDRSRTCGNAAAVDREFDAAAARHRVTRGQGSAAADAGGRADRPARARGHRADAAMGQSHGSGSSRTADFLGMGAGHQPAPVSSHGSAASMAAIGGRRRAPRKISCRTIQRGAATKAAHG